MPCCLSRLIKEFDREVKDLEIRNDPETNKMLNEKKQSMVGFLPRNIWLVGIQIVAVML